MNKTITINPALFAIGGGRKSRKKTAKSDNSTTGIKVRAPKEKKQTVKKNHILRFLREKQENNMKELIKTRDLSVISGSPIDEFKSDFDSALEHLTALTKDQQNKQNSTIKKYPNVSTESLLMHPSIHLDEPVNIANQIFPINTMDVGMQINPPAARYSVPMYGCLKGGTLPTYRMYKNVSQKQSPMAEINNNPIAVAAIKDETLGGGASSSELKRDEMKKTFAKSTQEKQIKKMRFPKQKRTVRRTFKVGKSKTIPKVSVLISNKTLRNQISTKAQLLKQTSMQEVRQFLTKKGFIRVGSDAPNDVLRKMYESAVLICGEVQNHNPDNLLYNFLNDIH
jgi:hypothetical protein